MVSAPSKPPSPQRSARQAARARVRADQNGALLAGAIMAGCGVVMWSRLVNDTPPSAFPRWLFFITIYITITGFVTPLVWYLNRRFSIRFTGGMMLRQSMWFGLLAVTAAWLQMIRALTPAAAIFFTLSIIVIEIFLRLRERPQS
jgi:hypothetical protein